MRLGLKLAAFGVILLLPKTHLYLSNPDLSEAETASERPISGPVALSDANSTSGCLTVSADGKQAKSFMYVDGSDTVAIHAMDKRVMKLLAAIPNATARCIYNKIGLERMRCVLA
jgi:hypothetical protein